MTAEPTSPPPYTKAHFDFEQLPYLTSPRHQLQLRGVAIGLIRLPAGEGYTFTHHHAEQEEVYIVVNGAGELLANGDRVSLATGDLVRVSPDTRRALRAADNTDLLVICAGGVPAGYPKVENSRYLIDDGVPHYDDIPPWYAGDPAVQARNAELKARLLKAQARRSQPPAS